MKKYIYGGLLVILLLLGVQTFKDNSSSPSTNKTVIKIGIMMPLSGDFGAIGEGIGKASKLAIKEYEAKHPNTSVQIVEEDDKFDVKTGIAAYTKLTTLDRIDGMIMVSTPILDAQHALMKKDGIPVMSVGLQNDGIADDNIFQLTPDPNGAIAKLAQYAQNTGKHTRIAVVHANTAPALIGFYETFKQTYPGDHVDFMINSSSDAKAIATKIAAARVDGIVIMTMPGTGAALTKNLLLLGVTPSTTKFYYDAQLSTGWAEYEKQISDMKKIDGSITLQFSTSDLTAFKDKYKKEYGSDPAVYSEYGYDGITALLNAYHDDKKNWIDMIGRSNFGGYSGQMKFDERGVRIQESEMWVVRNGVTVKM